MEFNKEQKEVISTITGNISVIAAAGSGKTAVIVHRIENMVKRNGYLPSSILAVTFSKKAKENIVKRLEELDITNVNIETFHSLALKIITASDTSKKYKVWKTEWEKENALNDICESLNICTKAEVPYNEIFSFISRQKVNMIDPDDDLISSADDPFTKKQMKDIYKQYEKFKESKSYIEFDDFLNMANKILDSGTKTGNFYKNRFRYVMVDEFQDISLSQSLFLKKLNMDNTMIVGDPLQAIYSFRGGDSRFIFEFHNEYENTKVINLNTNYRCSADIVNTANRLAFYIPDSSRDLYVESIAHNENNKIPELYHFNDEYDEAVWIAEKIKMIKVEGYTYDDIAILSRTNAQLQKLETVFYDSGIAYDIVDGKGFTDLPEIKLIISYLQLSLDQNDDEAFSYLYNKPNRWLDKKFLQEVKDNSIRKKVSMYESMFTIARREWRFKKGINEIKEVIEHIQDSEYENVSQLVSYLRKKLDIDKFVTKGKQSDDGKFVEQIENLDSFEKICEKYTSVEGLIYYLNDLNEEAERNKTEKVRLSTIHRAKGLEYPVVFIVGCNDGLLPHQKCQDSRAAINDEKRLLYVAITRAEKELYLSYVDSYNNKMMDMSPFIEKLKGTIKVVKKND